MERLTERGTKVMDMDSESEDEPNESNHDDTIDYFLVKLGGREDHEFVINGRPQFDRGRFLTLRKWVPIFWAPEASLKTVVVWIKLLELLIEYYDPNILSKIGEVTKLEKDGSRGTLSKDDTNKDHGFGPDLP
ncbi:hypothetical protein Golob_001223 [Gossypium lobatum]|uniref:DUF4283 domain-containing protein n=1 Tax=Gossypium lobatum TaxID=34289 RepID=A0A7J8NAU8_9ROSI|nr:hypothetical protein [Gossypium lobatum]